MAKITYIEFNGTPHELDIKNGITVMQGAINHSVRGMIGECGGAGSCATCHVYVDPAWLDKVGEQAAMESALLEEVCGARPNSRLSCQITVADKLNGLVVSLPEKQI